MDFIIRTKRLLSRPFQEEDVQVLNSIANQRRILKWMPDWQLDMEETRQLIKYFISQYLLVSKTHIRIMFAVELDGNVIGMVGVGNKKEVNDEIEIAYFISEPFEGKGYISEAVQKVSNWALKNLEIDYLIAIVEIDNHPSQRIVEKSGFRKIDTRNILNSGETQEKPFYYYRLYK